jgi:hypothetical protein
MVFVLAMPMFSGQGMHGSWQRNGQVDQLVDKLHWLGWLIIAAWVKHLRQVLPWRQRQRGRWLSLSGWLPFGPWPSSLGSGTGQARLELRWSRQGRKVRRR